MCGILPLWRQLGNKREVEHSCYRALEELGIEPTKNDLMVSLVDPTGEEPSAGERLKHLSSKPI